nr:ABC transporter transmembrane domain-containing protein [Leuconostoc lactis]
MASVVSAAYYGYIVERSHHKDTTLFFMMIVAGITVVLLRYVFDVINQTLMVKFVGKIMYGIREKTMARITANQVSEFGRNKVSSYTSNLLNDVELIEINLIEPFFDLISQIIVVIISSAVILYYQPTVFLIIISSAVILYYQPTVFLIIILGSALVFLIPTLMSKKLQEKQLALSEKSENLTEFVTDILNGFATVKATQTLPYFLKDFQRTNQKYTQSRISSGQWIMSNYATSATLGLFVQYAAALTAIWFIMQGAISIGIMLTMVQTMNTLVYPLIGIFQLIPQMKSTKPIVQKLKTYPKVRMITRATYQNASLTNVLR